MEDIFGDLLVKGIKAGHAPAKTQAARNWYRNAAKSFHNINDKSLMLGDKNRLVVNPQIGSLYQFYYDPKHKATLPFYDRFPLVFPFAQAQKGFLGVNMHYLPPTLRARLMDALYTVTNNHSFDNTTKLNLSYGILSSTSKMKYFRPTVKHYLADHVRSKFVLIHPAEWDIALWLPTQRFEKASTQTVWSESRKKIG